MERLFTHPIPSNLWRNDCPVFHTSNAPKEYLKKDNMLFHSSLFIVFRKRNQSFQKNEIVNEVQHLDENYGA